MNGSIMPGNFQGGINNKLHIDIDGNFDNRANNNVGRIDANGSSHAPYIEGSYIRPNSHEAKTNKSDQFKAAMIAMERKNGHVITGTKEASQFQRMLNGDFSDDQRHIVDSGPTKCAVKPVMTDEDIARCKPSRDAPNRLSTPTTDAAPYYRLNDLVDAVWQLDVAKVDLVLRQGVDINGHDGSGITPLIAAIKINNLNMVRLLTSKGANPNLRNSAGISPIVIAKTIRFPNAELIDFLMASGAINPFTQNGNQLRQ